MDFPRTVVEITPEWLTRVLPESEVNCGVPVRLWQKAKPLKYVSVTMLIMFFLACSSDSNVTAEVDSTPTPPTRADQTSTATPTSTAAPELEFTSDQMAGDWLIIGHGTLLRFSIDGIYIFGPLGEVPEAIFDGLVIERGNWDLDDGVLVMVSNELSNSCQSGQRGSYVVSATDESLIELQLVDDECGWRRLTKVELERIR